MSDLEPRDQRRGATMDPMALDYVPYSFTVEQYEEMGRTGILTEDDRVELIEGEIVRMAPIGPPHGGAVNCFTRLFTSRLGDQAIVSVQNPAVVDPRSQPQPDLLVLRNRADFYRLTHPTPGDILLAVEVAASSLRFDRMRKMPLYARTGIVEAWVVDLGASRIEVYRGPSPSGYTQLSSAGTGETVSMSAFPDVELSVDEILGL